MPPPTFTRTASQLGPDRSSVFQLPSIPVYEEDVHRGLTTVLALAVGFSDEEAKDIGLNNQRTDEDQFHRPMPEWWQWLNIPEHAIDLWNRYHYHFVSEEQLQSLWREFEKKAISSRKEALLALGIYLHAYQDAHYAHAGYRFWWGHLFHGHTPDKPFTNPEQSLEMASLTYKELDKAYKLLEAKRAANQFNAALGPTGEQYYDEQVKFEDIEDKINEFVIEGNQEVVPVPTPYSQFLYYGSDIEMNGTPSYVPRDPQDPTIKADEERILCEIESFLRQRQGRSDVLPQCVSRFRPT